MERYTSLTGTEGSSGRPALFPCSLAAAHNDHGLVLGDRLSAYFVVCTGERALSRSIDTLRTMMLSMMKKLPKRKIQAGEQSKKLRIIQVHVEQRGDTCPTGSDRCDDSRVRVRNAFPSRKTQRKPVGSYAVRGAMCLFNIVHPAAVKRGEFFLEPSRFLDVTRSQTYEHELESNSSPDEVRCFALSIQRRERLPPRKLPGYRNTGTQKRVSFECDTSRETRGIEASTYTSKNTYIGWFTMPRSSALRIILNPLV